MTKKTTPQQAARPSAWRRIRTIIFLLLAAAILFAAGAAIYVMSTILPNVPKIDAVLDYRPKIPLRVYTADNHLIGEFGVERRDFVPIAKIPNRMKQALLAIEDAHFYEHHGIDWRGAARAVVANLREGFGAGGASTITMQVARNFFLTKEKVLSRKFTEIALAYRIEDALTKDQILELYMNQIFLGNRSYGFSSA
ncbi:transglycosylase domain-containing protein, partial [uncultured Massilia sp.]